MGLLLKTKSIQEKSAVCNFLRKEGLHQDVSPYRPHGFPFDTICIFFDHFYGCHWGQVEAIMEDEEMLQVKDFSQLRNIFELRDKEI